MRYQFTSFFSVSSSWSCFLAGFPARVLLPALCCLALLSLAGCGPAPVGDQARARAGATRDIRRVPGTTAQGARVRAPLYSSSHALIIGVSDYARWPRLPGVRQDVKEVKQALERLGFTVRTVLDPDGPALRQALDDFVRLQGRDENARLLIYFAGHGHTLRLPYGATMGYIVPTDAPLPDRDRNGFLDKAVDMREMEVLARRILAKHALFLFDSCFSGSVFAFSRAVPASITYKTGQPVRQFITSGQADEEVPDESVFRRQFVAALEGEADVNGDGYVTGSELGMFLQDQVVNYSNKTQHPQYGKLRDPNLDKGDFVFVLRPGEDAGAGHGPPPPPLPEEEPWERYRQSIEERRQWAAWQERMEAAFRKVEDLDRSSELSAAEKRSAWEDFLRLYGTNNPLSKQDDKLRGQARERVSYWKTVKPQAVPSGPAPAWTDPVTGMEFVYVPGGCFMMGSPDDEEGRDDDEGPVHEVCVDGFWMGKYEVTNRQYRLFRPGHDSKSYKGKSLDGDDQPVVYVSWNDARAYASWLAGKTGKAMRLPTEAEWEYAARARSRGRYFWDGSPDQACMYANVADETIFSCDDGYAVTAPVGSFRANGFGLYDMLGNVWEWVQDWYGEDYYASSPRDNPRGPASGSSRVVRGGSWLSGPRYVRAANRGRSRPGRSGSSLGFRLAFPQGDR